VPIPVRYWTASAKDLMAKVHTIIRTTIAQYYVRTHSELALRRVEKHAEIDH
jgi:hypothetical protein